MDEVSASHYHWLQCFWLVQRHHSRQRTRIAWTASVTTHLCNVYLWKTYSWDPSEYTDLTSRLKKKSSDLRCYHRRVYVFIGSLMALFSCVSIVEGLWKAVMELSLRSDRSTCWVWSDLWSAETCSLFGFMFNPESKWVWIFVIDDNLCGSWREVVDWTNKCVIIKYMF